MVNALFARRFLSDAKPLGAWIKVSGVDRQIVGVVEDGPHNHLPRRAAAVSVFPVRAEASAVFHVDDRIVRGSRAPGRRRARVPAGRRRDIHAHEHSTRLAEHMRDARSDQQLAATVSGALAAAGLLLAAAGLFGVTLFAVTRRTPEFGVRVAMGASPGRLLRQVLREAALRVAIALPLGWALTYGGRRAIAKLLYGIAPDDPWTFAAATAVVAMMAFIAALYPALRASRIDPMTALRHE